MNVKYLSLKEGTPAQGYWDHTFLNDILHQIKKGDRHAVVIPGAYQADKIDSINREINQYKKVVVFITSDEEHKFPFNQLQHSDMKLYVQYLTLPIGYAPLTRPVLTDIGVVPKVQDWFFSGQVTHPRRIKLAEKLRTLEGGILVETDGFAKGMKPWEYYYNIAASRAVFCPPGPVSADSFRLYETLEAGSVPIVEEDPLWHEYFADAPFPKMIQYDHIEDVLGMITPEFSNQVFAWWIKKKWELKEQIRDHVGDDKEPISVIIPVSPIPSHPSTKIIDETIKSIRAHLKSDIFVTIDGIRPEQENMREKYTKFIRNFLWKCNFEYQNVIPIIYEQHLHQSGMLKKILPLIKTPYLLYVEHDTPLTPDRDIEWQYLTTNIFSGKAHVIRFHFEEFIPEEHKYLMVGEPEDGLQRTVQWSQRPHLARTAFYKNILRFFSKDAKCFIEDLVYGKLIEAWDTNGIEAWKKWKLWIYHPEKGIKRSYHLDGREGTAKFDEKQIW